MSSDFPAHALPTSRKNHSVDMKMPVGTTRASVAMAAVRAMRDYGGFTGNINNSTSSNSGCNSPTTWGKNLRTTQVPPSFTSPQQQLLGFQIKANDLNKKKLGESYSMEISRLTKENAEYTERVALLEQQLNNQANILKVPEKSQTACVSQCKIRAVTELIETPPSIKQVSDPISKITDSTRNSDDPSIVPQYQIASSIDASDGRNLERKKDTSLHKENGVLLAKVKKWKMKWKMLVLFLLRL